MEIRFALSYYEGGQTIWSRQNAKPERQRAILLKQINLILTLIVIERKTWFLEKKERLSI